MKASDNFKTVIENYLKETALSDTAFAQSLAKTTKNLESCINYIFGEVKKTGLCAFDNQEIFDMALRYYNDDSITTPAIVNCRAVVNPPVKADLFSSASNFITPTKAQETVPIASPVIQKPTPSHTTLTLFDL